jgi:hypothetical protein
MKLPLIAIAAILLLSPAKAEENTIGAHFAQAHRAFAVSSDNGVTWQRPAEFLSDLLKGIDGRWVEMSTLANVQDNHVDVSLVNSLAKKFCSTKAPTRIEIARKGEFQFIMTTATKSYGSYIALMTYKSGNVFSRSVDPIQFFKFMKVEQQPIRLKETLLKSAVQDVRVYRPFDDVLVLQGGGLPDILIRCPAL